jgi:hypothetical protein
VVAKPVANAVDRAPDSSSGAPASQVLAEPVRQAAETVDAVVRDSGVAGVTHVPVVEDIARHAGAATSSLTDGATGVTKIDAAPRHPSPLPDIGDQGAGDISIQTTGKGEAGPAPHEDWVGPPSPWLSPSPSPRSANETIAQPFTRGGVRLAPTFRGASAALPFAGADLRLTLDASVSTLPGDDAGRTPAPARHTPTPVPPPLSAALSTPLGGAGSAFFVLLLLGLLAGFALAVPRTPARRLATGCKCRSALFVCALERPG